jgi:hypothetical protein
LRLSGGIPLPLAVYGYVARDDGDAQLDFIGSLGVDLSYTIDPATATALEAWLDTSLISASDADVRAIIYFVGVGLGLSWRPAIGDGCVLDIGVGFSALAHGIVVDDGMRIDTWSFGLRARAALDFDIAPGVALGPLISFHAHDAPIDATHWYNRPLRGTRYLRLAVAARFSL